jgi:hypothetical protein
MTDVNLLISDHAARQYLERVLGVDVGERLGRTDRGWFMAACTAAGLSADHVKAAILTPKLREAIAAGAARFKCETHVAAILRGGDGTRFVGSIMTPYQSRAVGTRRPQP